MIFYRNLWECNMPVLTFSHKSGTSSGINVAPGSDDDGWIVPPPIALADGTRVQLYKDGEALHAAYESIKNARRRVCLEVYILHDDDTGNAFAELLCDKARNGVRVRVIYDSFGSIDTHASMFEKMKSAGVSLREFHPIRPWDCQFSWRPFNRDHRKLLVVDDEIAGMGGMNIGTHYAGPWVLRAALAKMAGSRGAGSAADPCTDNWRDSAIGIVGPGARTLLSAFRRTWDYCGHGGRIAATGFAHNLIPRPGAMGVLASAPTVNSPLRPFLHRLLRGARRSIFLTMAYFAPDDPLITALCAAARRGVRVRLMLPGKCDVRLLQIAAQSFYETLLTNGVHVYERQGCILHAKTMVIDDQISVIGSTNLDYRSIEYNCELSVIINDPTFGRQMRELFNNDVGYAKRIALADWRYRPHWDRFVQWAVSRARYLL
jgi:cardiolipin synthase